MKKIITIRLLLTAVLLYTSCEANKTETHEIRAAYSTAPTGAEQTNASKEESYKHVKSSEPIKDILNHPAFDGFGE